MEIFNEVILMLLLYTVICFTPWIPEVEIKVNIGYLSCLLVTLHLVLNLALMLGGSIKGAFRACKLMCAKKRQAEARVLLKNALKANRHQRRLKRRERKMLYEQKLQAKGLSDTSESDEDNSSGEDSSEREGSLEVIQEVSQESEMSARSDPLVLSLPKEPLRESDKQRTRREEPRGLKPNLGLNALLAHQTNDPMKEQIKDNFETLMRELASLEVSDSSV